MKVDKLIEMLEPFRGFDVHVVTSDVDEHGINIHTFELSIGDVGYSDKVLQLDIEEVHR